MSQQTTLALEKFLAYRVVRFANKLSNAVADIYTDGLALSVPQWRVLATLAEHNGLTAKTIATRTAMDKVKVSRALKLLEARGLLSRHAMEADRRAFQVSLTDAGWALYYQVVPEALDWQDALLKEISDKEYQTFMYVMDRLEQHLDETGNA